MNHGNNLHTTNTTEYSKILTKILYFFTLFLDIYSYSSTNCCKQFSLQETVPQYKQQEIAISLNLM